MHAATNGGSSSGQQKQLDVVLEHLKRLYKEKLLPIEKDYQFDKFHSPHLTDADLDAKPLVLLMGQYSVGKTTFIRYLLERDFPGVRIGPEPTTDRFTAIMWGRSRAYARTLTHTHAC